LASAKETYIHPCDYYNKNKKREFERERRNEKYETNTTTIS